VRPSRPAHGSRHTAGRRGQQDPTDVAARLRLPQVNAERQAAEDDVGMLAEVVIPGWVVRPPPQRRDDRYSIAVVEVERGIPTRLPCPCASRLEQRRGNRRRGAEPTSLVTFNRYGSTFQATLTESQATALVAENRTARDTGDLVAYTDPRSAASECGSWLSSSGCARPLRRPPSFAARRRVLRRNRGSNSAVTMSREEAAQVRGTERKQIRIVGVEAIRQVLLGGPPHEDHGDDQVRSPVAHPPRGVDRAGRDGAATAFADATPVKIVAAPLRVRGLVWESSDGPMDGRPFVAGHPAAGC
jgi:hypothetical protein